MARVELGLWQKHIWVMVLGASGTTGPWEFVPGQACSGDAKTYALVREIAGAGLHRLRHRPHRPAAGYVG